MGQPGQLYISLFLVAAAAGVAYCLPWRSMKESISKRFRSKSPANPPNSEEEEEASNSTNTDSPEKQTKNNKTSLNSTHRDAFFQAVSEGSIAEMEEILQQTHDGKELAQTCNELGDTPLLLAIKGNHVNVIRYLIDKLKVPVHQMGRFLWNEIDYPQVPPLFAAILCDQTHSATIVHLITGADPGVYQTCLKSVLSSSVITRSQKIDILELMGAVLISEKGLIRPGKLQLSLEYWTQAMHLRQSGTEGDSAPIPKIPHKLSEHGRNVFENVSEFTTLDELEYQTTKRQTVNTDWLKIQALLVILRIVQNITPVPNAYSLWMMHCFGRTLSLQLQRKVSVEMFILEQFHQFVDVNQIEHQYSLIFSSISSIEFCLQKMNEESNLDRQTFYNLLMSAIAYCSAFAFHFVPFGPFQRHDSMRHLYNLVSMMVAMMPKLTVAEKKEFMNWLTAYFTKSHGLVSFAILPSEPTAIIETFLNAGADPNRILDDGDTLLHILAREWPYRSSVTQKLIDDGRARLDVANEKGETVKDIFNRLHVKLVQKKKRGWPIKRGHQEDN